VRRGGADPHALGVGGNAAGQRHDLVRSHIIFDDQNEAETNRFLLSALERMLKAFPTTIEVKTTTFLCVTIVFLLLFGVFITHIIYLQSGRSRRTSACWRRVRT
jgi:hypothetical protein